MRCSLGRLKPKKPPDSWRSSFSAGEPPDTCGRRNASGCWRPVYPEKEDAQAVRQQLRDQHDVDSYLFEISIPSVSLRMTGMRGQIDILEAAFLHAEELIRQMERISETLDRQEITPAEAAEELNTLREQVELVALRMEQRFLSPRNAAVTGLIGLMRDYAAFAREETGQESNALLSRQLKYQTIQTIRLLLELTDALRNT